MRPPAIAPGIEPMPPITAAVKPLRPATKPIATVVGTRSANITPAAPASAEPRMNVNRMTRLMSMPIISAASHGGKRDDRDQRPHGDVRARGATEQLQHAVADERAHHEDVAVGEVEELQYPVDERVPEGDERIDAAERQRVDGELDEGVHRKARWAALSRPPGVSEPSYPTSLYEPFCWIWKM